MLKSIDILIGVSVVMLVASMAVTVMTGFVTYLANTRGRNLRQGFADLLSLISSEFTEDEARQLAEAILLHPLIRDGKKRLGTVVHREELTRLLLEFGSGSGPQKLAPPLQRKLADVLDAHGLPNPGEVLVKIRVVSLELETAQPLLSNTARAHVAILREASSDLVAKIDMWFDQTIDRVSHRFTNSTRVITFFAGLLLAVALQLDVITLVNRLSVDDAFRESLVKQAEALKAQPQDTGVFENMLKQGLISMPTYPADFSHLTEFPHLAGILFTTLLLSLGAPFWYAALSQILQLRSKITQEDDEQRKERQTSQEVVVPLRRVAEIQPAASDAEVQPSARPESKEL